MKRESTSIKNTLKCPPQNKKRPSLQNQRLLVLLRSSTWSLHFPSMLKWVVSWCRLQLPKTKLITHKTNSSLNLTFCELKTCHSDQCANVNQTNLTTNLSQTHYHVSSNRFYSSHIFVKVLKCENHTKD